MLKPQRLVWEAERRSLQRELCGRSPAREDSHPSLRERRRRGRELGHLLPLSLPLQAPRSRGGGGSARNGTRCTLLGYPLCKTDAADTSFPFPQTASPAANKDGGARPRHAVRGGPSSGLGEALSARGARWGPRGTLNLSPPVRRWARRRPGPIATLCGIITE